MYGKALGRRSLMGNRHASVCGRMLRVLDGAPEPLRDCVAYAAADSRLLGHGYLGSEHLLLGLLRMRGSRAAELLTQAGVAHDRVTSAVTRIVGVGERLPPGAQLPFTARSARIAWRVVGEGERLGHDAIGSEHVLRALLRAGDGVAFYVLSDLGVDVSDMAKGLRKPRPEV
jgi:ATP-dependent Clp protease ATP-binding subunit ClpC